jgi:hypothetical protein
MEHEFSLPCSQQPAAGPYPEPDESIPQPGLQCDFFPSRFPTEILNFFYFLRSWFSYGEEPLALHPTATL